MKQNIIQKNSYYDSASLMLLASMLTEEVADLRQLSLMMGNDMNKNVLKQSDLLLAEGEAASQNDLIIAFEGEEDLDVEKLVQEVVARLNTSSDTNPQKTNGNAQVYASTVEALESTPTPRLAVVSIPGQYASREVKHLLNHDTDILLFSDNVSIEEEVKLKDLALEKNLLMMGPDCGTAIIDGVGLGFANKVRLGNIGMVAAAGTGLQEVACLIHQYGGGISQAYGTGGRDVKDAVGGRMMLACLERLVNDPKTEVITIVSKPADQSVMDKILAFAKAVPKPIVLCFMGGQLTSPAKHIHIAETLEEAAVLSMQLSQGRKDEAASLPVDKQALTSDLKPEQRYIRGVYCGGTLSYESLLLLRDLNEDLYANVHLDGVRTLVDPKQSLAHTIVDLGDDFFTVGRPHPMIDPSLRNQRLAAEFKDPTTAIILLDLVLGYGAHENPAQLIKETIEQARSQSDERRVEPIMIASICGTDLDAQGYQKQKQILEATGMIVCDSNAQAAKLAKQLLIERG